MARNKNGGYQPKKCNEGYQPNKDKNGYQPERSKKDTPARKPPPKEE